MEPQKLPEYQAQTFSYAHGGETYAQPSTVPSMVYVDTAQQATPVAAQQQYVYSNVGSVQYYAGGAQNGVLDISTVPKPLGRWSDNLCDWPKNLFPSCYCASCCIYGLYIQAQSSKNILLYLLLY
jgi:hypothetical protein